LNTEKYTVLLQHSAVKTKVLKKKTWPFIPCRLSPPPLAVADGTATGTPIAFIAGQFEFKSGYLSVQNIVLKKTDFYFPKGEKHTKHSKD
jgi:hypothetical protein